MAAVDAKAKRREERVKLFATAMSNSGVAAIAAGVIGPLAAGRFQPLAALIGFVVGAMLHLGAQLVLHYVVSGEGTAPKERPDDVAGDMVRRRLSPGGAGDGDRDVRDHPAG